MHAISSLLPAHPVVRVVLVVACGLHFCLAALLGLSVDEAHYALYAAHPDWSYFDHPPLVGWVQWPLVVVDAPTWVLRLVPELLWLGTALLVYRLAERLNATGVTSPGPPLSVNSQAVPIGQAGCWAVLAFALAPLLHVLGIGLLPDTLLMFFTAALIGVTLDLTDKDLVQRPWPWLGLGVVLGLAGLSKYTAILGAVAVALCLLAVHGMAILRNRWSWMALVVAVALVVPVAYWNHANQWVSFSYQAKHGAGGGWAAAHLMRFLVLQVLVYGPLLLWGLVGARRGGALNLRLVLLFFAVPFVVLATLSAGGTSLPHWTAPAWVAMVPLAGVALARTWQHGRRWVIVAFVVVQGVLSAALMGLMLSGGVPFVTNSVGAGNSTAPSNPFADLHGWSEAGERARSLAVQQSLSSVSAQNWTLASRLGWYARPLPVFVLEDRFDQFDLWAGDLSVGGSTLLVDWSQLAYTVPLGTHGFANCTLLDTQEVRRLGSTLSSFRFYACHGWSGQPQPRLQGEG